VNKRNPGWILISLCVITFSSVKAQENPHGDQKLTCEDCHTSISWEDIHFDHEATHYKLESAHVKVSCSDCHALDDFSAVRRECLSCHTDVHEAKLGSECVRCHSPSRWEIFDTEEIHRDTRFPMMGRHNLIDCWSCHANLEEGDFTRGTTDCVDCHENIYLSTENPRHVSLGFSTACVECHEPPQWNPAFFPGHDALFPIFSGEHDGSWDGCADCHPDPGSYGVFTCLTCHGQADMDQEHGNIGGYSYDSIACLMCHPTGSKSGLAENHDSDYFPIFSGSHASEWQSCTDCHDVSGDFTAFSCVGCHEHDRSSTDQGHSGIPGYEYESSMCYLCHPSGESGEFREHDTLYFPIYSGKHRGKWDDCSSCHNNPDDRSAFTCIDCHEHDRSKMDEKHHDVPDYVYESSACFECHPRGEEEVILWKKPPSYR